MAHPLGAAALGRTVRCPGGGSDYVQVRGDSFQKSYLLGPCFTSRSLVPALIPFPSNLSYGESAP